MTNCQHPWNDITLVDRSTILSDGIGTVPLLFYVNGYIEKISSSDISYCSILNTKLTFLVMLDRNRLTYLSPHKIPSIWDSSSTIIIDRLTSLNFYRTDIFEITNKVSTWLISTKIDFGCAMITDISKVATDLFIWHRKLAHLNKILVKKLFIIVIGMEIV